MIHSPSGSRQLRLNHWEYQTFSDYEAELHNSIKKSKKQTDWSKYIISILIDFWAEEEMWRSHIVFCQSAFKQDTWS